MKIRTVLAALAALLLLASIGSATTINPLGGGNGSELNMQQILNGITLGGTSSVNAVGAVNDALADGQDAFWSFHSGMTGTAQMIIEIAGYASGNVLGLYDPYDISKKAQIFPGSATTGIKAFISFDYLDNSLEVNGSDSNVIFSGNLFGFFLTNAVGQTFYSHTAQNSDGFDHMVAFRGNDKDKINLYNLLYPTLDSSKFSIWDSDNYIFGWEDLLGGGDHDYNDMVFHMTNLAQPVPEPGTLLLLGFGLIGVAAYSRRKLLE